MKILLVLCVLGLISLTNSKIVKDTQSFAVFNRKNWTYMTKMAFAPGTGNYDVKVQFSKKINMDPPERSNLDFLMAVYLDEDWPAVIEANDCQKMLQYSKANFTINVPFNGNWSPSAIGQVSQTVRTRVWYFVLHQCGGEVTKYSNPKNFGAKIQWEVDVRNTDGSHFSEDENGMLKSYMLVMFMILAYFGLNSTRLYRFYKREESMDYPTLIICIVLFLEFMSLFCEVIHLLWYAQDGKGSFLFNFGNQAFSVLSQFTITCLLLLLAYGWSIRFMDFEDSDIFLPIGILFAVVHIMIVGVGRVTDNEYTRFHDYENWAGFIIILLRLLMFCFWLYLYNETTKTSNGEELVFYKRFKILSLVYFLTFPVLVILNFWVAPYLRHKVITIGTLLLQTITIFILARLFTNKESKYYSVSLRGRTLVMSNKFS